MHWLWWVPSPWFWIHLGMAVVASWRLAELLAVDTLTAPLRKWAPATLSCLRCVSVWGAGVALVLWGFIPWANWPLALAWTYLLKEEWGIQRHATTWPKRIVVMVQADGRFTVQAVRLPPETVRMVFHAAADALHDRPTDDPSPPVPQPQ